MNDTDERFPYSQAVRSYLSVSYASSIFSKIRAKLRTKVSAALSLLYSTSYITLHEHILDVCKYIAADDLTIN